MKPQAHPAEPLSMPELAARELRRRILDNAWPPGYQALEQEVALALSMSRTPVREALICLQNEGLVELIPRHGMRVLPVSLDDMREIYEILTALECAAVELVARRRPTDEQLLSLAEATRDMAAALEEGGPGLEAWAAADERFHAQLLVLCGNRQLRETVLNYWDRAHRARMFTLRLRAQPVNSTQEHLALVERLRAGDAQGAVDINRAHRQRAGAELLSIFERFNLQQM
jgi:DNA-binding GntR family transcriptional regulator